jgi:TolB protein
MPNRVLPRGGWLFPALAVLCLLLALPGQAWAKVYIDITSPQTELPIAVHEFAGTSGREIADIVSDDLAFTGLFRLLDRKAFIETPSGPFNSQNWSVIGADAVVKGEVELDGPSGKLTAVLSLYDVFEGREILKKRYSADRSLLRPLAHSMANDIYQKITGQPGVFRTTLAYLVESGGETEIMLADWDGGRSRRLGVRGSALLTPHWSDDGTMLVYSAKRGIRWSVYLLDFTKKRETLVYSSSATNMAGDFFPGGVEFALSSSVGGSPDIYSYNISYKKLTRLTSLSGIEVSPAVSPDGLTIAFVSDKGGSPQIYTMNKIGYNMARLTYEGQYNTSPAWSPKGDMLAFSGRYGGRNQIFVIRPDGTGLRRLTDAGNNEDPSFSPDGRYIVFSSDRAGRKGVYIMRANGEGQRRITPSAVTAFGPRWSPE